MKKQTLKEAGNLQGKRVLMRSDFNVDIEGGRIVDDLRIQRALPTFRYLVSQGAKVIIICHLGRPDGVDESFRIGPIVDHMKKLLPDVTIHYAQDTVGEEANQMASELKEGEILFLENVRFHAEDQEGDKEFAKQLARFGEIFVNDAFGVDHRADASVAGVAAFLPTYAGMLLEQEVHELSEALQDPPKPYVFVFGGAKLETKISLIKQLLDNADHVVVGGALANTFLKARGVNIGTSVYDDVAMKDAEEALRIAEGLGGDRLILPVDVATGSDLQDTSAEIYDLGDSPEDQMILDIGPKTVELFSEYVGRAETIAFNGAMGVFENPAFARGTKSLYESIARSQARTVGGGGETIIALNEYDLFKHINFVSTGGGAMLTFLEGAPMPGLDVIPEKS